MINTSRLSQRAQNVLIWLCFFTYTASYVSRYGYSANIVSLTAYYGVTNAAAGIVGTCFFFTYGFTQIFHGFFSKYYPKRVIIPIVMGVSATVNVIAFLLPAFGLFKYLWVINGLALSVLWPTCMLILSENLDEANMKKAVLIMSATVPVGTVIVYSAAALFNLFGAFRFSFFLGAGCALTLAVCWFFLFGRLDVAKGAEKAPEREKREIPAENKRAVGIGTVALLLMLCFAGAMGNLIKDGLNTWVPQILKQTYGFTDSLSVILTIVMPILGAFSAAFAVFMNKRIRDYNFLLALYYVVIGAVLLGAFLAIGHGLPILLLVTFGLTALLAHAINALTTSIAPLQLRDRMNTGMTAGIINGSCYAGSTVSSYLLGSISDRSGWSSVFLLLLILAFATAVCCLIYACGAGRIAKKNAREKNV